MFFSSTAEAFFAASCRRVRSLIPCFSVSVKFFRLSGLSFFEEEGVEVGSKESEVLVELELLHEKISTRANEKSVRVVFVMV